MELAEDGETFFFFWGGGMAAKTRQDFPQSITADSITGFGQVYESCI